MHEQEIKYGMMGKFQMLGKGIDIGNRGEVNKDEALVKNVVPAWNASGHLMRSGIILEKIARVEASFVKSPAGMYKGSLEAKDAMAPGWRTRITARCYRVALSFSARSNTPSWTYKKGVPSAELRLLCVTEGLNIITSARVRASKFVINRPPKLSMATSTSGWINGPEDFEMPPASSVGSFEAVNDYTSLAASLSELQTSYLNALEQQIKVNRFLSAETQRLQNVVNRSQEQQLKINILLLTEIQWLEKLVLERDTPPIGDSIWPLLGLKLKGLLLRQKCNWAAYAYNMGKRGVISAAFCYPGIAPSPRLDLECNNENTFTSTDPQVQDIENRRCAQSPKTRPFSCRKPRLPSLNEDDLEEIRPPTPPSPETIMEDGYGLLFEEGEQFTIHVEDDVDVEMTNVGAVTDTGTTSANPHVNFNLGLVEYSLPMSIDGSQGAMHLGTHDNPTASNTQDLGSSNHQPLIIRNPRKRKTECDGLITYPDLPNKCMRKSTEKGKVYEASTKTAKRPKRPRRS
ncbi:hypothetical protein K439DRAFT_1567993 [Ramaria rubella]|nr:hypothetical protein K439DRAFT_1567993 [Ramaria rubella]